MVMPKLDPDSDTKKLLLRITARDNDRLRVMADAIGTGSVSALVRRYVDEGLARDERRLERRKGKRA
jgi:hypothetical protein